MFSSSDGSPEASTSSSRRTKARPVSVIATRSTNNGYHNSPYSSNATGNGSANGRGGRPELSDDPDKREGELLCDAICDEDELYRVLGVGRRAKQDEIRRAFLSRSRLCHPE